MAIASKIDYLRCKIKSKPDLEKHTINSELYDTKAGKIRIVIAGNSDTTVFLSPDPPNSLEHYTELIDTLKDKYRVVAFEPPGFGYSRPSFKYGFNVTSLTKLLSEIAEITNSTKIIMALPCIAGYSAIDFASKNPEIVKGILIIQTADWEEGKKWVKFIDRKKIATRRIIGQIALWVKYKSIQLRWYNTAEPDEREREKLIKIANERTEKGYNFCLASPLQTIKGKDPLENVNLHIPSKILWGQLDKTYPNTDPTSISKYTGDSNIYLLENSGHFPELTSPKTVLDLLDEITLQIK